MTRTVYRLRPDGPDAPAFLAAVALGGVVEIDMPMKYAYHDARPPVYAGRPVRLPCGRRVRAFGFAGPNEYILAIWSEGGRHYCWLTDEVNAFCQP